MSFHVRDAEAEAMVRQYAEEKRLDIAEAIKLAVTKARAVDEQAREDKLAKARAICAEVASWPRTGLKADKAFFDSLNDE